MVEAVDHLHHVDRQLDVHVALDPTPTLGIGKLLCRLRHQAVAIVVEPVDQRPDRRVLLVFQQGGIVEGSDQMRLAAEQLQQSLVIDRSEEHTSELQSLMRISYAVFCLKKKT